MGPHDSSKFEYSLIETGAQLDSYLSKIDPSAPIAIDTETNGLDPLAPNARLLGISLSQPGVGSAYIVITKFDRKTNQFNANQLITVGHITYLRETLSHLNYAIGANYAFDADWISARLKVAVNFRFDTQIAWHHADAPYTQKSYGLKALQKEILGWSDSNAGELHANVKANGGDPKKGQYYFADIEVLGRYAALDALATYDGYVALKPFFDRHDYMAFHDRTCAYRTLLRENTVAGIFVNRPALETWIVETKLHCEKLEVSFLGAVGSVAIQETLQYFVNKKAAVYKSDKGRLNFINQRYDFNFDSNLHLSKLFYDVLGEEIREWTPAKVPAVHKTALMQMAHPAASYLLERNGLQKCIEYAEAYLGSLSPLSTMHPSFNVTGTLTGRVSGFAPNVHQMPIGEESLMRCFEVPAGRIGAGADLTSVEPFFTAYFSDDPTLLKVYRDGRGDIYLDLALDMFPTNLELKQAYNPLTTPSAEVKKTFNDPRHIAKLVHLASQYGAGGPKIALILTQNGFPTDEIEGRRLHRLYWSKFKKVKEMEAGLYELNRQDGQVTNLFGRILRLPDMWCKDLLNRFIQSTGHDALIEWVFEVDRLRKERGVDMIPFILDWHDATYWHTPIEQEAAASAILSDALTAVNTRFALPYPLKAAVKIFKTLAEIK